MYRWRVVGGEDLTRTRIFFCSEVVDSRERYRQIEIVVYAD